MSFGKMSLHQMPLDRMLFYKMSFDQMSYGKMSMEKMLFEKMLSEPYLTKHNSLQDQNTAFNAEKSDGELSVLSFPSRWHQLLKISFHYMLLMVVRSPNKQSLIDLTYY